MTRIIDQVYPFITQTTNKAKLTRLKNKLTKQLTKTTNGMDTSEVENEPTHTGTDSDSDKS